MAQPSLGAFAKHATLVSNLTRILGEFAGTRKVLHPRSATVRQAAVMCPLVIRNNDVHVLFTLRSGKVGTHKNQVSFPGGHLDVVGGHRETATQAAVRECKEELGDALNVTPLGLYHDALAITGTIVTPVIGVCTADLSDLSVLTPSTTEVDSVFSLSLQHLVNASNSEMEFLPPRNDPKASVLVRSGVHAPVFLGGPARIWGLTAILMLGILRDCVLPAAAASGMGLGQLQLGFDPRLPPALHAATSSTSTSGPVPPPLP